ncbi:hypothetical protein T492DRAFT_833085 [Pavlovales sp. CCMP2436]|nr:hypothetical protein T492DRAFT_833085 [Pavlovales sp. CCMP2436]
MSLGACPFLIAGLFCTPFLPPVAGLGGESKADEPRPEHCSSFSLSSCALWLPIRQTGVVASEMEGIRSCFSLAASRWEPLPTAAPRARGATRSGVEVEHSATRFCAFDTAPPDGVHVLPTTTGPAKDAPSTPGAAPASQRSTRASHAATSPGGSGSFALLGRFSAGLSVREEVRESSPAGAAPARANDELEAVPSSAVPSSAVPSSASSSRYTLARRGSSYRGEMSRAVESLRVAEIIPAEQVSDDTEALQSSALYTLSTRGIVCLVLDPFVVSMVKASALALSEAASRLPANEAKEEERGSFGSVSAETPRANYAGAQAQTQEIRALAKVRDVQVVLISTANRPIPFALLSWSDLELTLDALNGLNGRVDAQLVSTLGLRVFNHVVLTWEPVLEPFSSVVSLSREQDGAVDVRVQSQFRAALRLNF